MVKKITLTKDHLKLIPFFLIQENDDENICISKEQLFNLGSHLLEDMAMILGMEDKAIPNTSENEFGRAFEDETETYLLDLHNYLITNLSDIETLIHQYVTIGGLTEGTYKSLDNELIWTKE